MPPFEHDGLSKGVGGCLFGFYVGLGFRNVAFNNLSSCFSPFLFFCMITQTHKIKTRGRGFFFVNELTLQKDPLRLPHLTRNCLAPRGYKLQYLVYRFGSKLHIVIVPSTPPSDVVRRKASARKMPRLPEGHLESMGRSRKRLAVGSSLSLRNCAITIRGGRRLCVLESLLLHAHSQTVSFQRNVQFNVRCFAVR